MLAASVERMLDHLQPSDVVLDIGGWGRPFNRADWVMDLMPYESRGPQGFDGPYEERFSAERWIQRDICSREPYPFTDNQLDFVICSHTLEDVRDPVWVCSEMARVAKAGYIEVPSRLEEQSYGFQGPWVGWGHHRWLVDVDDDGLHFVFKHHVIHGRDRQHFRYGFHDALPERDLVETFWWESSFGFEERVFVSPAELDPYLADYVTRNQSRVPRRGFHLRLSGIARRFAARWL